MRVNISNAPYSIQGYTEKMDELCPLRECERATICYGSYKKRVTVSVENDFSRDRGVDLKAERPHIKGC